MDLLLIALLLASTEALAQGAVSRAGLDPAALLTYAWLVLMGMVGGLVSFYQKVKTGAARWLNISELIGEMFTSGFVGFVTGLLCQAAEFSVPLTFALVGITGHMGGRAIFFVEHVGQGWVAKRMGVPDPSCPVAGGDKPEDCPVK